MAIVDADKAKATKNDKARVADAQSVAQPPTQAEAAARAAEPLAHEVVEVKAIGPSGNNPTQPQGVPGGAIQLGGNWYLPAPGVRVARTEEGEVLRAPGGHIIHEAKYRFDEDGVLRLNEAGLIFAPEGARAGNAVLSPGDADERPRDENGELIPTTEDGTVIQGRA